MLLCICTAVLFGMRGVAAETQTAQQAEQKLREEKEHERAAQLGAAQRERGREITEKQEEKARQIEQEARARIQNM